MTKCSDVSSLKRDYTRAFMFYKELIKSKSASETANFILQLKMFIVSFFISLIKEFFSYGSSFCTKT